MAENSRFSEPPSSPSAFEEITSIEGLTAGWDKVLANGGGPGGGGPGGDGETLGDFARQADARIARLAFELAAGFYRPGPLRRTSIPKSDGIGRRGLAIPSIVDRVVQSSAAIVLSRRLEPEFEDVSFAYRPGRGVAQAVARVSRLRREGFHWVVDGDIRAFFDEVPHAPLLAMLGRAVPEPRLTQLVGAWLESFSEDGKGLAQGSPLSPILSNLHLDALDEAMEGSSTRIVRFADDFVVLTRSRPRAEAALARVERLLTSLGLEINREKTRIVPFEEAFAFLGHVFVRSLVRRSEADGPRSPSSLLDPPRLEAAVAAGSRSEAGRSPPEAADPSPVPEPSEATATVLLRRSSPDPLEGLGIDRDADDFARGLAPLYVLERGARVVPENEGFAVSTEGRTRMVVPARLVGRIDLGPDVEADDGALRLAAAWNVPVHFLDGRGAVAATLSPSPRDAALHVEQARLSLEPARRLAQARAFAAARLRNQHALLKRLDRRRRDPAVAEACDALLQTRRRAEHAETLDSVRGFEGAGAALYWPALGRCLLHGWTHDRRRRHPARDPVNAALDWAASLLTREVHAAVTRAGLHPGFGTLHAEGSGQEALVYDLVEAFRAPLAEGFVVYLFNNRILKEEDFTPIAEGCRFNGPGGRAFVEAWERWIARVVKNPRNGKATVWRGLILAEARAFAVAVRDGAIFTPHALDW